MKEGDIIAFAKINKPYSYGKIIDFVNNDELYVKILYENPLYKYEYGINYSSNSKFRYAEVVKIKDCSIILNKNKIKEIMHLHNKLMVFK